jgi:adenosine deaminase
MIVRLILSINRTDPEDIADDIVNLAIEYKAKSTTVPIIGIDICGNPLGCGISHLVSKVKKAKAAGLKFVCHFAEVENTPEPDELTTLLDLRPDRIGHATYIPESMMLEIISRKIPIEICLTSNILCKTVKS